MRMRAILGAGSAALLAITQANAHHPGGAGNVGGAGPIVTISAATLAQGQSSAAILFEMTKIGAFSDGRLADFASRHIHAHSMDRIVATSVAAAYGITNDLMISARLPYVTRTDIREAHHEHVHGGGVTNQADARGDASGVGDLTTLLHWRFHNNPAAGSQWALLGGVKAPTGATNRTDRAHELFELEFQPGSGSWDWLLGLATSQRLGIISLHANVLYTFAGTGEQRTDLGDRFQYNLAASYRLIGASTAPVATSPMRLGGSDERMHHGAGPGLKDHAHVEPPSGRTLDLVLELNGEWHGRQGIDGVKDPNSGGTTVYLSPGVRLSGDKWTSFLSVGVPIVTNLYGVQAEPDYRIVSGIAVSF